MCGLVAQFCKASNGFTKKAEDAFFDMLFADTVRGDDATGILAVQNDGSFGIVKDALAAPFVIDTFRQENIIKEMFYKGKAFIGHNRKATVGRINANTAHPFVVDGKFAMVHNGTLYQHKQLADTDVDSEALAIHLSKVLKDGVTRDELDEAMGKVFGAYAIIAYNMESEKVYFMRNKDRPLNIIEHGEGFALASEAGLGVWCISRNGMDMSKMKVTPVKEEVLYTVDLKDLSITEQEFVPKKATPHSAATTTQASTRIVKVTKVTHGTESEGGGGITKNAFKRFRRQVLNKKFSFFIDDYVEKRFPLTIEQGETELLVFGESDHLNINHTIQGEFDLRDFNDQAWRITEKCFEGKVSDVVWNREADLVTVTMTEITAFNAPIIDAEYIRRKLDEQDKHETKTSLH